MCDNNNTTSCFKITDYSDGWFNPIIKENIFN